MTAAEITFKNAQEMEPENLRGMVTEFRERRKSLFDLYWKLAEGKNYSEMSPLLQKIPFMIEQLDDYERRLWQLLKEVHAEARKTPQDRHEVLQEIQQFKERMKNRVNAEDGHPGNIKEVIQDMESFLEKYEKKGIVPSSEPASEPASTGGTFGENVQPVVAVDGKGDTESLPKEIRGSREKPVEVR